MGTVIPALPQRVVVEVVLRSLEQVGLNLAGEQAKTVALHLMRRQAPLKR
jgi:hypothetical protein